MYAVSHIYQTVPLCACSGRVWDESSVCMYVCVCVCARTFVCVLCVAIYILALNTNQFQTT